VSNFFVGVLSSVVATVLIALVVRLRSHGRRVSFRRVVVDTRRLATLIESSGFRPEAVVAINRSGAIAGAILCGLIDGLITNAPLVIGLSLGRRDGKRTTTINRGVPPLGDFKRVVVLSCVNDTGSGLTAVTNLIDQKFPAIEIKTAAIYTNAKALIRPDFFSRLASSETGLSSNKLMTRMPWMVPGWRHDLSDERATRPTG
jgi:hypoxanthine phosphoribosyltransferase